MHCPYQKGHCTACSALCDEMKTLRSNSGKGLQHCKKGHYLSAAWYSVGLHADCSLCHSLHHWWPPGRGRGRPMYALRLESACWDAWAVRGGLLYLAAFLHCWLC